MGRTVRRKVVRFRFCSVRGCPNYGRSFRKSANVHTIPIFNCPTPNSPMLKEWLKALKMQEYDSRIHICIRHFEEDCIIREKTIVNHDGSPSIVPLRKPVLKKHAVPTVFVAYDEMKMVKTPVFIKSEVPDLELGWLNEDLENCKMQNTVDDECQISVENEAVDGSCKRKRKRIRGAPVGPQVKKPRAKELFYPCPICHSLIQRRRQMINHMQKRHPDDDLTKRVLKEREVNPRGQYQSLSPYLSLAIKAPDGFYDYPSKDEDKSHCPPSDFSQPPSPSLSPTPSDCEDPLAGRPASTEPPTSPESICILPELFFDDAPSATPVPRIFATSTSPSNVSEPCDSESYCQLPLPSPPPLVPIHVPSYPCLRIPSSTSDSAQNAIEASPLFDDSPSPQPSSDQEDAAISSGVIYSSWDLSVFKVHLYNIPKEKKDFLKKRLMELVEAVTVRNLDPESIIIAYCDRSS